MKKFTIGIDVGGTNVKLGLVNPTGRIISRSRFETKKYFKSKTKLFDALVCSVNDLIQSSRIKNNQIFGVGIGLPGLIDPFKGIVHYLPNIPGWRKVPLKRMVQNRLKIPTFIDNDVNMITLAEWRFGAGKNHKNLICITLGTGVGGGLILHNRIYRGEGFVAGEIGHIPVGDEVLEHLVGNGPLQKKAAKIFRKKDIRLEEVFALAGQGNASAIQFWKETGQIIGTTLAGVVNVLNPPLIIIGGGISNNLRYLGPAIRQTIKAKSMKVHARMVKIVRAQLGDDAGIIGAQILVGDPQLVA